MKVNVRKRETKRFKQQLKSFIPLPFFLLFLFLGEKSYSKPYDLDSLDSALRTMSVEELALKLFYTNSPTPTPREWGGVSSFSLENSNGLIHFSDLRPLISTKEKLNFLSPNASHLHAVKDQNLIKNYLKILEREIAAEQIDWLFVNQMAVNLFLSNNIKYSSVKLLQPQLMLYGNQTYTKWSEVGDSNNFIIELPSKTSDEAFLKFWNDGTRGFFTKKQPEEDLARLLTLIKTGKISENEVRQRVRKVIQQKKALKAAPKPDIGLLENLQLKIRQKSITIIADPDKRLPLPVNDTLIVFQPNPFESFQKELERYVNIKVISDWKVLSSIKRKRILAVASEKLTKAKLQHLRTANSNNAFIMVNFGLPEQANELGFCKALVQAYSFSEADQKLVAQAVMGGREISGAFPKLLSVQYDVPRLDIVRRQSRLQFPLDKENAYSFQAVDEIVKEAIEKRAFPGCQVFVAHKGKVVLNKSYGHQTYNQLVKIRNEHIYDIASITKIAGTTTAMMHLYDKNKVNLMHNFGRYVGTGNYDVVREKLPSKNVFDTKIYELLVHKSGIRPHPPILNYYFYEELISKKIEKIVDSTIPRPLNPITGTLGKPTVIDSLPLKLEMNKLSNPFDFYFQQKASNSTLKNPIVRNMYFKKMFRDTLVADLLLLKKSERKRYRYSDVNFALLHMLVDSVAKQPMKDLLSDFYNELGIKRLTYLPLEKFDRKMIVPTEYDAKWRKQLIQGYVHDPFAALLGGVSGNAGLFGNAESLGIFGQWLLQSGSYGEKQLLRSQVVTFFSQHRSNNKRALGFDTADRSGIVGRHAHPKTFGHTGFTGACVWVDPVNELVYVFLSNRIHPNQNNKQLQKLKIRSRIHDAAYEGLGIAKASR